MAKIKNPVTIVQQSGGGGENKLAELVDGSITTITAEDLAGATSIKRAAFSGCNSLTNVIMPNSITNIGTGAFENCFSLISVTMSDSVISIGQSAFSSCTSLANITIPDSVTSIGQSAFYGCSSLTDVIIGSGLTSTGTSVFYNCSSLNNVIYQGQVPNIQSNTFYICNAVTKYDFRNCTTVPTLANTNSLGHASGCQIIIPDALYDTWTTSSVWSDLTDVTFVKASEYVE